MVAVDIEIFSICVLAALGTRVKIPVLAVFGAFFKLLILTDIFLPKLSSSYALFLVVRREN